MKSMLLAVSGASGKTGWRVVQEALAGGHQVRALLRPGSEVPPGLEGAELVRPVSYTHLTLPTKA